MKEKMIWCLPLILTVFESSGHSRIGWSLWLDTLKSVSSPDIWWRLSNDKVTFVSSVVILISAYASFCWHGGYDSIWLALQLLCSGNIFQARVVPLLPYSIRWWSSSIALGWTHSTSVSLPGSIDQCCTSYNLRGTILLLYMLDDTFSMFTCNQ